MGGIRCSNGSNQQSEQTAHQQERLYGTTPPYHLIFMDVSSTRIQQFRENAQVTQPMTATKSFNLTCWNIISKAISTTTTISYHLTRNDPRTTISTETTEATAGQSTNYCHSTTAIERNAKVYVSKTTAFKDPNGTQNSKAFGQQ
jgi:hypothetical protein